MRRSSESSTTSSSSRRRSRSRPVPPIAAIVLLAWPSARREAAPADPVETPEVVAAQRPRSRALVAGWAYRPGSGRIGPLPVATARQVAPACSLLVRGWAYPPLTGRSSHQGANRTPDTATIGTYVRPIQPGRALPPDQRLLRRLPRRGPARGLYNVPPTETIRVVVQREDERRLIAARVGIPPVLGR